MHSVDLFRFLPVMPGLKGVLSPAAMGRGETAKSSQISHISALFGGKNLVTAEADWPKFPAVEPDR